MDEYDPMPDLMAIVEEAMEGQPQELQLEKIVVGAFPGNQSQVAQRPPFAFLRSVGGPEEDAQVPEAERRLDITVFAATEKDANRISNRIHRWIRRGRQEDLQTRLEAWLASRPAPRGLYRCSCCPACSAPAAPWTYWSGTSSCRACFAATT